MSGGHYEYSYFKLYHLADEIEREFAENPHEKMFDGTVSQKMVIQAQVEDLVRELRKVAFRAKELEWYMSGDTTATTYLERLGKGE